MGAPGREDHGHSDLALTPYRHISQMLIHSSVCWVFGWNGNNNIFPSSICMEWSALLNQASSCPYHRDVIEVRKSWLHSWRVRLSSPTSACTSRLIWFFILLPQWQCHFGVEVNCPFNSVVLKICWPVTTFLGLKILKKCLCFKLTLSTCWW